MNDKEFLKKITNIEEDLIEEASQPIQKPRRGVIVVTSLVTAAAVASVAILSGLVIHQNQEIKKLRQDITTLASHIEDAAINKDSLPTPEPQPLESETKPSETKTPAKTLGESYQLAANYEEIYDTLFPDATNMYGSSLIGGAMASGTMAGGAMVDGAFQDDVVAEDVDEMESMEVPKGEASSSSSSINGSLSDKEFSKTNVMTQGVDESDIVKTDGNFIYQVLSSSIQITDIRNGKPGESVKLYPKFESPSDRICELYVDNNRLTIIASHILTQGNKEEQTLCLTYDISDPMNATFLGTMTQDGSYRTSRKIGNLFYLFTNQYTQRKTPMSRDEALLDENLDTWLPSVNNDVIRFDSTYLAENAYQGLVVSSFDINSPQTTIDSKYILSAYTEIYVSNRAIYLYHPLYSHGVYGDVAFQTNRSITEICRIDFKDGHFEAGASTTVRGTIMDSFAINDSGTNLRVLTTDTSSTSVNTLYILDDQMKMLGCIDEIARGEQIYAARFLGNMAYFITFESIDPLFVADLSNPREPKLLGSVEITGFSEYLHFWDETHLLGIGYGETKKNDWHRPLKLVMFDVSDPAKPVVENSMEIKNTDYSTALNNYKAVLAAPEKNLIGFATQFYGEKETICQYKVFSYDKSSGFSSVLSTDLKYNNIDSYRGLYSGKNFYIAGNGTVSHFDSLIKE